MSKRSKRYQAAQEKIDKTKTYSLEEAIKLIKGQAPLKFDATIEIHLNLGIDPKQANQMVRGTIKLPHNTGRKRKIIAFVTLQKEQEAKQAGADIVAGADGIKKIKSSGKCDFDVAVAEPKMMKSLAPIAKILGQKGLMPNPKTETISENVGKMILELKSGKTTFKADDAKNLHLVIGRVSSEDKKLIENAQAFLDTARRSKPDGTRGQFIRSITLATTMGPGVKISQ